MMLTDDDLATLISGRYADAGLTVPLDEVEHRGRQRRRNSKVALGAGLAVIAVVAAGGVAVAANRHGVTEAAGALDRACRASYATEAAGTRRAPQLPPALGAPVIEIKSGKATFRLYATRPGPTRSMIFDCYRTAGGSTSGRISYGPTDGPALTDELVGYRDYLPDGTVAIVARLTPTEDFVVTAPGVRTAVAGGFAVAWGSRAATDTAYIHIPQGDRMMLMGIPLGTADLALTATYQDRAFEDRCQQTIAKQGHTVAALALTTRHGADHVLKVYRGQSWIGLCVWDNLPDQPADGLTYDGPGTTLASSDVTAMPQEFASEMFVEQTDGSGTWMAGLAPPGTLAVDVTLNDGTIVPAQVGDGVYAVWLPDRGEHSKVVATTATETWTSRGSKVTRVPR